MIMSIRNALGLSTALQEGQSLDLTSLVDTAKAAHDHLRTCLQRDRGFATVICRALGCECGGPNPLRTLERRAGQIPGVVRILEAEPLPGSPAAAAAQAAPGRRSPA